MTRPLRSAGVGDAIGPGKQGTLPPAAWYRDPWGLAPLRWWDGWNWTAFTSLGPWPGAASGPGGPGLGVRRRGSPEMSKPVDSGAWQADLDMSVARPATSVELSKRRRLTAEIVIVLAIFPLPYVVNAFAVLIQAAVHEGTPGRFPLPIPSHLGYSFLVDLMLTLEPLAAAALVVYLLRVSGEGGTRAIGLDRSDPRQDLALLLPVFLLCFLVPELFVSYLLQAAHVRAIAPARQSLPGYFSIVAIATSVSAGVVEEIVVLGFLVRRLEQRGLRPAAVLAVAVLVRISYHLYYGWGVLPILAWALASVLVYLRYRRLGPFIVVHAFWDTALILWPFFGASPLVVEVVVLTPSSFVFWLMWRNRLARLPDARRSGPGWRGL